MQDETNNDEILKKKAQVFYSIKKLIHISYKNGSWKRGTIEEISEDFFLLNERREGLLPVFFKEIIEIDVFKSRGETENGKQ